MIVFCWCCVGAARLFVGILIARVFRIVRANTNNLAPPLKALQAKGCIYAERMYMRVDKKIIVGIACAVLCALFVFAYTQSIRGEADRERSEAMAKYGGDQVEVCVATHDIPAGETLSSSAIEVRSWLVSMLPDGAVTDAKQVVGKQVTSPIVAGEVVSTKRFGTLSSSFEVPAGMVAVSVSAKDVQAVGGALKPGLLVDIYSSGTSGVNLIAQGVNVLATSSFDAEGEQSGAALSWVALAVAPASVADLISAEERTELYFVLPGEDVSAHESENNATSTKKGAGNGSE